MSTELLKEIKQSKNEIYIIEQPKRILISFIVVNLSLMEALNNRIHETLIKLVDYSDLFFIFPESHFPEQSKIDKIKFTSLYRGCGFITAENDRIGEPLFKALNYGVEVLSEEKKHLGFMISQLSDLENVSQDFEKLLLITGPIERPVFRSRFLSGQELHQIYTIPDNSSDTDKKRKSNIFKVLLSLLKKKKYLETDEKGMYSTWHSDSPIIYLPRATMETLCNSKKLGEADFEDWINTFTSSDPRYLMSSLINALGLKILNMNFNEVEL